MNTPEGWAMFGFGTAFMLVLCLIALGLLLRRWGKVPPAELRGKPPEHQNCRCVPADSVRNDQEAFERMTRGTFENTPKPAESGIFVFVATDGRTTRTLINFREALKMLCAQYVTEDTGKQVQKLEGIAAGKFGCVSVIGGMVERPLKLGESSPSRRVQALSRDNVSPLRNHPEFAEDPQYVRQCIGDPALGEDYAARTGRIPELFEFRTGPESRGRLLTRKNAERMAGQHFPERAAADIVASLARGASSSISVGVGVITRFEPAKAR